VKTAYLAASPDGDIPLGPADLDVPFRISLTQTHPRRTLGDYLDALRDMLLVDGCAPLRQVLEARLGAPVSQDEIQGVRICTEKHGAFYHIASIEAETTAGRVKTAASTAVSARARAQLAREAGILRELRGSPASPFLPEPLLLKEVPWGGDPGEEPLLVLLTEWFEDFHEWHLSPSSGGKGGVARIWDRQRGTRDASPEETAGLFREIARILTLAFDPAGFRQVLLWRHAAGDFVVKTAGDRPLQARLTTVRDYGPLPGLSPEDGIHPAVAWINFFLDTALRMRLDRVEGVGGRLWAGEFSVRACLGGFFEAVAEAESAGRSLPCGRVELEGLLKSFSRKELQTLHRPVLDRLGEESPEEAHFAAKRLDDHVRQLHRIIREFRG